VMCVNDDDVGDDDDKVMVVVCWTLASAPSNTCRVLFGKQPTMPLSSVLGFRGALVAIIICNVSFGQMESAAKTRLVYRRRQ
jgi:hypothetical protein